MRLVLLLALSQSPIAPPRPVDPDAQPLARMPPIEDRARSQHRFAGDLPDALIDFLGRRHLCVEGAGDTGEGAEERRRFLSCATLPREEAEWRRLYAGEPEIEDALDQDPLTFRIPRFIARFDGGPPNFLVSRLRQEGVEPASGTPISVAMDMSPDRAAILITAARGDVAARTIRIPAAELPGFDMASASVWLRPSGEHAGLSISVKFGRHRGYCWEGEDDDRPEVDFWFTPGNVSASRQGWPDCNSSHGRFPVATVSSD